MSTDETPCQTVYYQLKWLIKNTVFSLTLIYNRYFNKTFLKCKELKKATQPQNLIICKFCYTNNLISMLLEVIKLFLIILYQYFIWMELYSQSALISFLRRFVKSNLHSVLFSNTAGNFNRIQQKISFLKFGRSIRQNILFIEDFATAKTRFCFMLC